MSLSRRGFMYTVGAGSAGLLTSYFIIGRGREAATVQPEDLQLAYDDDIIHIGSNENARGPGPSVMKTLTESLSSRIGRGYPPDHTVALVDAIAGSHGVERKNVIIGTGSGPILAGATRAFCSTGRGLVTASPTYETPESMAKRMGVPVATIPVDRSLTLDLDAMADASVGAGLVFLCNPNNPTGTAHPANAIEEFVRLVKRRSPDTTVLIDEAYIDYSFGPEVRSALPLALEFPGVLISRTFSKAHGMAGLRVGYAVGQPETLAAVAEAWHLGSMNTLSAAAAIASLNGREHMDAEKAENARVRDFTVSAFQGMGYQTAASHTNCIFVEIGRPSSWFREQCLSRGVRIGRDFPPFAETHSRISLGTSEEMERAVRVFQEVLST